MARTRRITRVLSLCTAVLLSAAGCVSAVSEGTGPRLRVAMLQRPHSALDPLTDDGVTLSRLGVTETLVGLDTYGATQPALAVSWQPTGPTGWRFRLREGVQFHDGSVLTPSTVVRSLTRAAAAHPRPAVLDNVDLRVKAFGEDEVLVTTSRPDPLLPRRLSNPKLSVLASRAYADGHVSPVRAGSGPFILTGVDGDRGAALERFEDYWGGAAKAAGLDVSFVPDPAARAAALRNGEADIVEALPAADLTGLNPGNYLEFKLPRTTAAYLNTRPGSVLHDPALRAAVREAIDVNSIIDGPYAGSAEAADGLIAPTFPWAGDRPARTLAEAIPVHGTRITLATETERAELPDVAAVLEQQLEQAGFVVDRITGDHTRIKADALAGRFDVTVLSRSHVQHSGHPSTSLYTFFACDGTTNVSGLCDGAVDQALTAAAGEPDEELRQDKTLESERAILSTDAVIPLVHEVAIQGDSPGTVYAVFDPMERKLVQPRTYNKRR